MAIAYQFLPWVRRGLAVALDVPDNLGVGPALPARGSAPIGLTLAGPHAGTAIAPIPMRLHGPGDVIGIDQRLVVRTDPKPNATNFEPNYLAIVDFDPPDFPWMLTPAKAQDDRRLRPWLVLVVLEKKKTGLPRMVSGALLPSIRKRGLHQVRVYELQGALDASFDARIPAEDPKRPRTVGTPWLDIGIADNRRVQGLGAQQRSALLDQLG